MQQDDSQQDALRGTLDPIVIGRITIGKWTLTQLSAGGIWIDHSNQDGEGMQTGVGALEAAITAFWDEHF